MIRKSTISSHPCNLMRGWLYSLQILFVLLVILFKGIEAEAIEPEFKAIRFANTALQTNIIITDSLPSDLIEYMNKGVPIFFEYRIELWVEKPGWFDVLIESGIVSYKVRYDPWEKQYSVVYSSKAMTVDNILDDERETIELLKSIGRYEIAIEDTSGSFYLLGKLKIRTMSFSNYKEVESWLKGEISGAQKPQLQDAPDKVGEFVFNLALRITGFKDMEYEFKSSHFKIGDLPLNAPQ